MYVLFTGMYRHRGHSVQCGGYFEYSGGYLEYTRGCTVHRKDIMTTMEDTLMSVGKMVDKTIYLIWIPFVLNTSQGTHDFPWYPSGVLMTSL